eukprot:6602355-Ditylum_brightwellii.AAC.1
MYKEFCTDPIEQIMTSGQLHWIGKITLMGKSCLPRKFLAVWHSNPCPVGRRQMTIRHSYIHALHMIGTSKEDDKARKLSD